VDEDSYWSKFIKHLHIRDGKGLRNLKCEVKLIDVFAESAKKGKNVLETLQDTESVSLFEWITEKGFSYGGIVSLAALQEEIIRARVILYPNSGVSAEEKVDVLEALGEKCANIRYLLYFSEVWNGEIQEKSWSELCKYGNLGRQIFPVDGSLDWEKMYYMSGLSRIGTSYQLPAKDSHTSWDDRILSWEGLAVETRQKAQLDRVKNCFDTLLVKETALTKNSPEQAKGLFLNMDPIILF